VVQFKFAACGGVISRGVPLLLFAGGEQGQFAFLRESQR